MTAVLEREGIELAGVYDRIIPNPSVESVDQFAACIKGVECDAVIALGGGSTLDTVKTGLCAATVGGSIADFFGFDLFHFQRTQSWRIGEDLDLVGSDIRHGIDRKVHQGIDAGNHDQQDQDHDQEAVVQRKINYFIHG